MKNSHDVFLDLRGLESPTPVIRTKETLDIMETEQILCVVTTKESAIKNIRTLVANNPYELLDFSSQKEEHTFLIRKK